MLIRRILPGIALSFLALLPLTPQAQAAQHIAEHQEDGECVLFHEPEHHWHAQREEDDEEIATQR